MNIQVNDAVSHGKFEGDVEVRIQLNQKIEKK